MRRRRSLMVLAAAFCIAGSTPHAADTPQLVLRGTYATGLAGDNAEVISIRHRDATAAISNTAASVDVLDLSDPDNPNLLVRVDDRHDDWRAELGCRSSGSRLLPGSHGEGRRRGHGVRLQPRR